MMSNPSDSYKRYYLAVTLVRNKKISEAKTNYLYIIKNDPNSRAAYLSNIGLRKIDSSYTVDREVLRGTLKNNSNVSKVVLNMQKDSTSILVNNVKINGTNAGSFVLDTGASLTTISTAFAKKIKLDTANARQIKMVTANGIIMAPVVKVDHIDIQGLKAENIDVSVFDISGKNDITGLLGLSFLNKFKLTVDKANNRVIIEK